MPLHSHSIKEKIRFASMGLIGTAIDFLVFNILIFIFGIGVGFSYLLYKTISFICATSNTFFLHKHITFKHRGEHYYKDISKFFLVSTFSFILNSCLSFIIFLILSKTHLPIKLAANMSVAAGIFLATIVNYFGYKHYVFKADECYTEDDNPND